MKKSKKVLITSGCSFSETIKEKTWPLWLEEKLDLKTGIHTGLGCQGNGMIARKAIHSVHEVLKYTNANDITVGIMWSGPNRHEQYSMHDPSFVSKNIDGWQINPVSFVNNDRAGWIIYNGNWKIREAKNYYRYIYDVVYSQILTLENIIRVQNYLKIHSVKYFMSVYMDEVLKFRDNPNLDHLYEQIDFNQFLPVEGEYEWCRDNTSFKFNKHDMHPTGEMHEAFTNQVIMPFLNRQDN